MTERYSVETISYLFFAVAFEVARVQNPKLKDEIDLLPYICRLLRLANDCYNSSLDAGETNNDAVCNVFEMFAQIEPSLPSRAKR